MVTVDCPHCGVTLDCDLALPVTVACGACTKKFTVAQSHPIVYPAGAAGPHPIYFGCSPATQRFVGMGLLAGFLVVFAFFLVLLVMGAITETYRAFS